MKSSINNLKSFSNPSLHEQRYEPGVLRHICVGPHAFCCKHSSMSV